MIFIGAAVAVNASSVFHLHHRLLSWLYGIPCSSIYSLLCLPLFFDDTFSLNSEAVIGSAIKFGIKIRSNLIEKFA